MVAKRCDRCGVYYAKNEPVVDEKDSDKKIIIHGIRIWKTVQARSPQIVNDATETYDLCDHCAKCLIDWMAEPSLKEEEV